MKGTEVTTRSGNEKNGSWKNWALGVMLVITAFFAGRGIDDIIASTTIGRTERQGLKEEIATMNTRIARIEERLDIALEGATSP